MKLEREIETKVIETLRKIKISKKEKIIVALSGGKDSSVTGYLLKKFGYNIEAFHIDLGMGKYSEKCLEAVRELCEELDIKLHVYDIKKEMGNSMCYLRSAIQDANKGKGNSLKNCAVCGVIKKWILNREVRKLKAEKIATGHNLDDEAQTFLLNIFKGSLKLSENSGPITRNLQDSKKKFIPRIKPLFYIPEEDIKKYSLLKKLPVVYEKCPCALDSYRIQVREFLKTLSSKDKKNIIKNAQELGFFESNKNFKKIKKIKKTNSFYCKICNEPSRNEFCKKCQLMKI